jgi:hypothetical protein
MGTQENAAARASDARDDLARITGIGEVGAKALYGIRIYRFRALALCDPLDLSQRLAEAGFRASPKATAKWVAEAEERSWETHAAFMVFFEYKEDEGGEREWRIRVYGHSEKTHGAQKPFPGVELDCWPEWILEQAKLPPDARPVPDQIEVAPLPAHAEPRGVQIKILEFRVAESKPSSGAPQECLDAVVRFEVSGFEDTSLMAESISFRAEIYVASLESGVFDLVASRGGQIKPGVSVYTSHHVFPFPELGRYRVYAVVHLLPPGNRLAYHPGRTLSVLPNR